jgi:hypothetical protein
MQAAQAKIISHQELEYGSLDSDGAKKMTQIFVDLHEPG